MERKGKRELEVEKGRRREYGGWGEWERLKGEGEKGRRKITKGEETGSIEKIPMERKERRIRG